MKKLIIGVASVITLDQTGIGSGKTVKLTIAGEDGAPLKDSNNLTLADIVLTYDGATLKYKTSSITISTGHKTQYIRLFFYSTDTTISSDYYPEDAKLESNVLTPDAEIVPVQYFVDYILAAGSKVDLDYEEAITSYLADKDGVRSFLRSAQADLERDCEMFFLPRQWTDKRDNYFERFSIHLWQFQTTFVPIVSLDEIKIMFGQAEIVNIDKKYFAYDKNMGILEFLPLPGGDSSSMYTLLLQNLSNVAIAVIEGSGFQRIPNMFQVTYTTGLFYDGADAVEKESIRKAVARRAYLDLINYIDPRKRNASESENTDGVQATKSFRLDKIVEELQKDERKFIDSLQRKYAKTIDMVGV